MLASLTLVNYIKLDEKGAHSTHLRMETYLELTTATVNQEGLESTIMNEICTFCVFVHGSDANTTSLAA